MNATHNEERLCFLLETVALEAQHLQGTDQRLFAQPFTAGRAAGLQADVLLAERLDAFAARFARLQDTRHRREAPPTNPVPMTGTYNPSKRILVTGGAGFLGSHLIDRKQAQLQPPIDSRALP